MSRLTSALSDKIEQIPVVRIVLAVIVIMALASLYVTSQYNDQQRRYVGCGGKAVLQTIQALKARDDAAIDLASSDQIVVRDRYAIVLLLAHAPNAPTNITLAQATIQYESGVNQFTTSIDNYVAAIKRAPLPDADCLIHPH